MRQVVRIKYRDVYEPEGVNLTPNAHASLRKKEPIPEPEPDFKVEREKYDPVKFLPSCTQSSSKETSVASQEAQIREKLSPCFQTRLKEHEKYVRRKEKDEKLRQAMESNKKSWEELLGSDVCIGHQETTCFQ